MKVCLAGLSSRKFLADEYMHCKYILESYYSMADWLIPTALNCELFLLDSGAFTFMTTQKDVTDFNDYLTGYINFINKYDIKRFFELDVDSIVGIAEVERLRKRLEEETGKKCIPVWHKSRGKDYFIEMCRNYDYIAIGGIASKEITTSEYKYFRWFIDTAHSYGCKIHALGFTSLSGMYDYNFDSADSTSWLNGTKFGRLYHFDGKYMLKTEAEGRKRKNGITPSNIDRANYYEWIRFQEFADKYL